MSETYEERVLIKITDVFIHEVAAESYLSLAGNEIEDVQLEIAAKLREYIKNAIKEVRAYNELIGKNRDVLCFPEKFSDEKPQL